MFEHGKIYIIACSMLPQVVPEGHFSSLSACSVKYNRSQWGPTTVYKFGTTFSFLTELSFKAKCTRLYRYYTASAVFVEQICTRSSLFIIRKYIWCSCSFGFDERIITLIKVEPGCPSLLCLHRSAHTASLHRDGEPSPHASHPGSGPIVRQQPLVSSHLVRFSNTFTFQKQSLSKWHQWLYCRKRPLKAQPLLPTIIERKKR